MYNDYPGAGHHHHQGHHRAYAPPAGPPQGFDGFPQGGYGGYAPPPSEPPPGQYSGGWGYGGPSPGPPPGPPSRMGNNYAPPPGPPGGDYGGYGGYPSQQAGAPHMIPQGNQNYGPQFEGPEHQTQQFSFQYSQCNGRKKALTIGINYTGSSNQLNGCINDSHNVKRFLVSQWGYNPDDIVMLTDDAPNPRQRPSRDNILEAMHWLVRGAQPNDSLFFHYSGHGGQTKDLDGDEDDGYDEVIYPVDFESAGQIVDDDMFAIMVLPLPPGCRLTAIFDSCHSGSVLDLPYMYSTEGKIKEPNLAAEAGMGLLSAATSYARGDLGGVFSSVTGLIKMASGSRQKAEQKQRQTRTSPADAISLSGCKDSQTSADTVEAGQATGAMSYAFIKSLSEVPQQSYKQLLNNIRAILRQGYSQKPQLSASHPIDTDIMFIM